MYNKEERAAGRREDRDRGQVGGRTRDKGQAGRGGEGVLARVAQARESGPDRTRNSIRMCGAIYDEPAGLQGGAAQTCWLAGGPEQRPVG